MAKKIFLGINNIASIIDYYKQGYESLGYKVTTCSYPNKYVSINEYSMPIESFLYFFTTPTIGNIIDYKLEPAPNSFLKISWLRYIILLVAKLINKPYQYYSYIFFELEWIRFVLKYDIFHLIWLITLPYDILDRRIKWIKLFRKKIIINFVGDDIRWRPLLLEEFKLLNLPYEEAKEFVEDVYDMNNLKEEFFKRLVYIRIAEKYADLILSIPDQSQLLLRPYYNFFIPIQIPAKEPITRPKIDKLKILHATTSRVSKGSNTLVIEMEKLQEKYEHLFDFTLLENKPRSEIIAALADADIVIYAMVAQGTGMFGLEAIINKTLLLTGCNEDYLKYPYNTIVVDTNLQNLEEKLLYYIRNTTKRIVQVEYAYKAICQYNDLHKVCANIIKQLYKQKDCIFMHYPNFFRNYAMLNSKYDNVIDRELINQWTNFVKDCDWYKKYVPSGERDGLIF